MTEPSQTHFNFEEGDCKVRIFGHLMTIRNKCQKVLKQQRTELNNLPHDVTLQIGSPDCQLKVHKKILVEQVEYFKAMFSDNFAEATQSVIDLGQFIDFNTVSKVIDFLYNGILMVESSEVQKMFQLSDIWGLTSLNSMCVRFMEWELEVSNCLDLEKLARTHFCERLINSCNQVICQYFQVVTYTEAFLDLSSDDLKGVLQKDGLKTGLREEDLILEAVLNWFRRDPYSRLNDLKDVLKHVHVSAISEGLKKSLFEDEDPRLIEVLKSWVKSQDTQLKRKCSHCLVIICGFIQSRTGPTCPKTPTVEKYDPVSDSVNSLKSLPFAPSYGTALNLMGYLIYISVIVTPKENAIDSLTVTTVFVYKALFDMWEENNTIFTEAAKNALTQCLQEGGFVTFCSLKNLIYVVTVNKSIMINVICEDGDIFCDASKSLPSLKSVLDESHCSLKGVVHKGQLFIIGGYSGASMERKISNVVLALSEDKTRWLTKASMISTRCDHAVVSLGDEIFVTGGYGGDSNRQRRMQRCERYDVTKDQWTEFLEMQQSRSHHCSIAMDGLLYTIGGKSYASQKHVDLIDAGGWFPGGARIVSKFIEVADPRLNASSVEKWRCVASLKTSRCSFSAVVI